MTASANWLIGAAIDPLCDRFDGFAFPAITTVPGVAGTALRPARRREDAPALA